MWGQTMSTDDHWLYSIDPTGTQGLIVDPEGFTVLEIQSHWVSLQPLLEQLCRDHNQQLRQQPNP